ncbi:MAG: hypothetical protein JWM85_55 [Acidimicrobiaceae bacterium]|nr:hypothetical protein [Acidimicrobiaceae bacterium]
MAILTAVALFALGNISGAIVWALALQSGAGVTLLLATTWADPILEALLLGCALVTWNETTGRSADLDVFANSDDDELASEIDLEESVARLLRSRFLASSALTLSALTAAGSVASVVGLLIEPGPLDAQRWGQLAEVGGSTLAVAALSLACLAIVVRTRREASAILK